MDTADLRKMSSKELNDELLELMRKQFNLRMQKGTGQLHKPSEIRNVRRDIARIKTVINEMKQASANG